jgi:hemoglobin/transferrin/lactoferrin receptor protein
MVGDSRRAGVRLVVSFGALMIAASHSAVSAQTAPAAGQLLPPVRVEAPPEKRATAKPKPAPTHSRSVARRRTPPVPTPPSASVSRDPTTDAATKTQEPVINTLAAVSVLRQEQITQAQPSRLSDIFNGMPSVWFADRPDTPGSSINVRGLQDFGRVEVLVDGAQQDFQRSGHFANGQFYVDPELLSGADVVRGPVANIYGSGGIGGVASFRTKDLDDILHPGEIAAVQGHGMYGTNGNQWLASTFGGARAAYGDVFLGGVFRDSGNYASGNGTLTSLQCTSNCAGYPTTVIPGNTAVPYSGNEIESGLAKLTFRPGEGQQIKISAITYNTNYDFGDTTGAGTTIPGIGVYGENIKNQTVTGQYTVKSPDAPLLDFKTEAYWNQTSVTETVKVPYIQSGIDFSGPPGTTSGFLLNTLGFRANNTSRFDTGPLRNTVTYGGDFNNDAINISTSCAPDQLINGACDLSLTPGGQRNTYGGFVEWKINYSSWLEVINAGRLDGFNLSGEGSSESGSRFSPKTTIGITPIRGLTPYFTYAEGYRAPSVTEAFVSGFHPGGFFFFEPNPNLQPEVGRTKEVGLNIKYDDVFSGGDKIRAKVNAFRNDITNYIDMVTDYSQLGPAPAACVQDLMIGGNPCLQYQNIGSARIEGLEFEVNYDAGWWFTGVSGQHLTGKSLTTDPTVAGTCALAPTAVGCAGAPLASIPPDQVSFLLGARLLDRKLNLAVRWTAVAAKPLSQIPTTVDYDINPFSPSVVPLFDSTRSYNLVNLYAGYQPIPDVIAALSIENLLNVNYTKYMCCSTEAGYVVPNPGITFKGSLTVRYGVKGS